MGAQSPNLPRNRVALLGVGSIVLSLLTGATIGLTNPSGRVIQYMIMLTLIVFAVAYADRSYSQLPWILRPLTFVLFVFFLGTYATGSLDSIGYSEFLKLWVFALLGIILGYFAMPKNQTAVSDVKRSLTVSLSLTLFAVSLLAAIYFFTVHGVPILSGSLEASRVDLAASGTGSLRLVAYLSIPASLMLFATRARGWSVAIIVSALVIISLGNRSPLIYLIVPLAVSYTITSQARHRTTHFVLVGVFVALAVASIGTYRIATLPEFQTYNEYSSDLASANYSGIASTTVSHYAETVVANSVLTKHLVDSGAIQQQYGKTLLSLILTASPGSQLTPDMLIRGASQKEFIGGGIPPTLAGEGYLNAGYAGVLLIAALLMALVKLLANRMFARGDVGEFRDLDRVEGILYGYMLAWAIGAQVAGLAGASTFPVAGFLILVAIRLLGRRLRS